MVAAWQCRSHLGGCCCSSRFSRGHGRGQGTLKQRKTDHFVTLGSWCGKVTNGEAGFRHVNTEGPQRSELTEGSVSNVIVGLSLHVTMRWTSTVDETKWEHQGAQGSVDLNGCVLDEGFGPGGWAVYQNYHFSSFVRMKSLRLRKIHNQTYLTQSIWMGARSGRDGLWKKKTNTVNGTVRRRFLHENLPSFSEHSSSKASCLHGILKW